MKKSIIVLMSMLTVLSFASCSKKTESKATTPSTSVASSAPVVKTTSAPSVAIELPKNIEVQVPAKAGGGTDVMARALANQVSKDSGSNFTIINNTDGSGVVAMEKVRLAKPDGATIMQFHSTMVIKVATGKYKYNPSDNFSVIAVSRGTEKCGYVMVVKSDGKYKTLDDLVNACKANPGKILFGVETGGSAHIMAGLFAKAANINIKYVEAGSDTEKLTALVGGSIDATFVNPNQAKQYVESGKVIALAVVPVDMVKNNRSTILPNVPNFVEAGYPFTFGTYNLFLGPKGMDPTLITKIRDYYVKANENPDVAKVLGAAGFAMEFLSPEDGLKALKQQEQDLTAICEELGLKK